MIDKEQFPIVQKFRVDAFVFCINCLLAALVSC